MILPLGERASDEDRQTSDRLMDSGTEKGKLSKVNGCLQSSVTMARVSKLAKSSKHRSSPDDPLIFYNVDWVSLCTTQAINSILASSVVPFI